jgi:hypothetical protein
LLVHYIILPYGNVNIKCNQTKALEGVFLLFLGIKFFFLFYARYFAEPWRNRVDLGIIRYSSLILIIIIGEIWCIGYFREHDIMVRGGIYVTFNIL